MYSYFRERKHNFKHFRLPRDFYNFSGFWSALIVFQRVLGLLPIKIHAGLPISVTLPIGIGIVSCSSYIAAQLGDSLTFGDKSSSWKKWRKIPVNKAAVYSILTTMCFALIERNFFRTTLPSSIISRGAFANRNGYLLATGVSATAAQRGTIQQFGKKFGCHHCGSRQGILLSRELRTFIADHIPPTKIMQLQAESRSLWASIRKKFFREPQKLYPQCQKCFKQQGSHVRLRKNHLIYHAIFRPELLSPVLVNIAAKTCPEIKPEKIIRAEI